MLVSREYSIEEYKAIYLRRLKPVLFYNITGDTITKPPSVKKTLERRKTIRYREKELVTKDPKKPRRTKYYSVYKQTGYNAGLKLYIPRTASS